MLIAILLAAVLVACGSGDLAGDVADESGDSSQSENGATAEPEAASEDRFASVSAGAHHTCGMHTDGSVECWSHDGQGQATPPAGVFTAISAGGAHTCGVRTDGSVECWGNDEYGQATPPTGEFASVSAGVDHTCGVQTDRSVECWGRDAYGEATPPAGEFAAVSAWAYHTCGVRTDNSVECWGNDEYGQATPPAGEFAAVSAGWAYTCGVGTGGSVECWGKDNEGQATPPDGEFTSLSAGYDHTCGVRTDGSAECWGRDAYGDATPPAGEFAAVSAGGSNTCGVRPDGSVECWGYDEKAASSQSAQTAESSPPTPEVAEDASVTETEYCRSVSKPVNEIRDHFQPINQYLTSVSTASLIKPEYREEAVADKDWAAMLQHLDNDVLAHLDYIDEAATKAKNVEVPKDAEKQHRKIIDLSDDVMSQADEIRKTYTVMTRYEHYDSITEYGISHSAPEFDVMQTYVKDFTSAYLKLPFVYHKHVFDELRASEICEGWWK